MTTATNASGVSLEKLVGRVGAFALHTVAIYVWAVHLSPWLVSRWFAYIAPMLHITIAMSPGDWYLQHLEIVTIFPAACAGYVAGLQPESVSTWAWGLPTFMLAFKMIQYKGPSSVLIGSSMSAFRYYFDIQTNMPTIMNPTAGDPVRALAQLLLTAPFYAGVAYSLGAVCAKRQALIKLFSFEKRRS